MNFDSDFTGPRLRERSILKYEVVVTFTLCRIWSSEKRETVGGYRPGCGTDG